MSKESFKSFARIHPELANHVVGGEITWQKLYELYDIYGEDSDVLGKYINKIDTNNTTKPFKDATVSDIFKTIKNVDLDNVQKGISNLQKTIGMIEELGIGGAAAKNIKPPYEARPMYKYFED